jgi:hypothetical protein
VEGGSWKSAVFAGGLIALVLGVVGASPANAAVITVASTSDSGAGTLRQAIAEAKPGDTIVLPASASHYAVTSAELVIGTNLTITGAGARTTVIDAMGEPHRVLEITGGTVAISGVTITGAKEAPEDGVGINIGGSASVTLTNVSVSGNTVKQNFSGGGISAGGSTTLTINASTIADNVGYNGGGLDLGGTTVITNSTIAGNQAGDPKNNGDGGALENAKSLTLINDTIAGNKCFNGHGCGGAIFGTATAVKNTIIAGNLAGNTTNEEVVLDNCDGLLTSTGPNLENGNECGFAAHGGISEVNPLLGPLTNNGGPTDTIALLPGSPAINHATNEGCPTSDQRGVIRPQPAGGTCDIGAVENAPPAALTGAATGVATTAATLTGSATNPGLTQASVSFQFGASTAYGSQTPAQPLAAGASGVPFSATLSALMPGVVYHFRAVATSPDGTSYGADQTFTTAPLPLPPLIPPVCSCKVMRLRVTNATQSHRVWREGDKLAKISKKRPPVGTTFSFTLNERATVRFAFTQLVGGRKVGGRCVAQTKANRRKAACRRPVTRGTLAFTGHAGTNKIAFQGRLSRSKKFLPGTYTLGIVATNAAGQRSNPAQLTFTIVK